MKISLKKLLVLLLALSLLLTVVAGCGNGSDTTPPSSPEQQSPGNDAPGDSAPADTPEGSQEKVNIRFSFDANWENSGFGFETLIQDAEARFYPNNPGIEITLMPTVEATQNEAVILQAVSGVSDFDIAGVSYGGLGITVGSGALLDLTGKVDGINAAVFPDLIDMSSIEGRQYIVPWWQDCRILAVNKQMFEEVGLDYPRSLDEMAQAAQTFADNGMYGFVTAGSIDAIVYAEWQILMNNNGGRFVVNNNGVIEGGFDTREGVEFLELMQILYDSMPTDGLAYDWGQYESAIATGGAAMAFAVPHFLTSGNFNFEGGPTIDFILTPAGRAGSTSLVGGYGLGVVSTTQYPEEALKVIEFLLDPITNANLTVSLPVVQASYEVAPFDDTELWGVFFEQFQNSGPYWISELTKDGQVCQAMYPIITEGLINRTPAAELSVKLNDAINRAIND